MAGHPVFDQFARDYDRWFDTHAEAFSAQLALLRTVIPETGEGLEVGVGSGRFASSLGIHYGLDPSPALLTMAGQRHVETALGIGEHLPYRSGTLDFVLMMTVICFLDDISQSLREAFRVIRPNGIIIVAFLEKDGEIAVRESCGKSRGRFLQHATFRTAGEVMTGLGTAGFSGILRVHSPHGFCIITARKA